MITGLDQAISRLTTKFVRIENAVTDEIIKTGQNIEHDAAALASGIGFFDPSGNWVMLNGKVKGGTFEAGNGYKIWVDAGKMGAYIEFGTGEYAGYTVGGYNPEWQDLAYTFYVNGKGKLPARPYMHPAFAKNTTGIIDRIKSRVR